MSTPTTPPSASWLPSYVTKCVLGLTVMAGVGFLVVRNHRLRKALEHVQSVLTIDPDEITYQTSGPDRVQEVAEVAAVEDEEEDDAPTNGAMFGPQRARDKTKANLPNDHSEVKEFFGQVAGEVPAESLQAMQAAAEQLQKQKDAQHHTTTAAK